MLNFQSPDDDEYVLTFEDDGKVAYAYLKKAGQITGAVWLYNRYGIPEVAEWKDRANIPFANCSGYMSEDGVLNRPVTNDDVKVEWEYEDGVPAAYVYLFEELFGVIWGNEKLGYARFATKNGPLAKVMVFED
jgi:hypothetical protein